MKNMAALTMFFKDLDTLGNKTFATLKWALTAMSGSLTTGLMVIPEICPASLTRGQAMRAS